MKNYNYDTIGCVTCLVIAMIVGAICFGIAWLIGTSNLPDWVKFWLLR